MTTYAHANQLGQVQYLSSDPAGVLIPDFYLDLIQANPGIMSELSIVNGQLRSKRCLWTTRLREWPIVETLPNEWLAYVNVSDNTASVYLNESTTAQQLVAENLNLFLVEGIELVGSMKIMRGASCKYDHRSRPKVMSYTFLGNVYVLDTRG